MTRIGLCCLASVLAVVLGCFSKTQLAIANHPDIVFILADDLAWSDLGCYDHPWHDTPHLDRLASEGLRFTDAYAPAPICSASRASILTGKTPARLGFEFVTKNEPGRQARQPGQRLASPPFTLNLALDEQTIAERLSDLGYQTAFFGKWHLNAHHGGYLGWSPSHGPKRQGFEIAVEEFGSHPYSYRNRRVKPKRVDEDNFFPEDRLTSRAIEAFSQARDGSENGVRPLFLMLSHFFVHTPVETECDWLLRKYDALIPSDVSQRERRIKYAAFVETLDHHVGRLLDAIKTAGREDDTLVVFTSDNGGHPEYTANFPLRGSKWNLYEGGIRVPMIVRWPGAVPTQSVTQTPAIGYDLLPTFVDIAGGNWKSDVELDGVSLRPVLEEPGRSVERELYWHFPYYHPENGYAGSFDRIGIDDFAVSKTKPQSAIRRGRWKLLKFHEDSAVELYDLVADSGESNDLSGDRRSTAVSLQLGLETYLDRVRARMPTVRALPSPSARE